MGAAFIKDKMSVESEQVTTEDPPSVRSRKRTPSKNRAKTTAKASSKESSGTSPLGVALETFLSRAHDIELAAKTFVALSHEQKKEQFEEALASLKQAGNAVDKGTKGEQAKATSIILDVIRKVNRLQSSDVPGVIQTSLFLGLFSFFDAFTGDLFRAIYEKKPILFERIEKTVELSKILQFKSFDELRSSILEEHIEQFRRDSYVKQIKSLEATFGFATLREFPNWPLFVECTQRRNLHTHNDGRVTSQYIKLCEDEGFIFEKRPERGSRLELNKDYLILACELVMEVAFKLTHTLWRKLFPEEFTIANSHLIEAVYDGCLQLEEWKRAVTFGEFAMSQKNLGDGESKILKINYAIGLKFSGDETSAEKILNDTDWSGAAAEFRLAKAVLLDDFPEAGMLMLEVGKNSNIITENGYYDFPLFREFRKSTEFATNYAAVFGYKFTTELKRRATKEKSQAVEGAKKEADVIRSDATKDKAPMRRRMAKKTSA